MFEKHFSHSPWAAEVQSDVLLAAVYHKRTYFFINRKFMFSESLRDLLIHFILGGGACFLVFSEMIAVRGNDCHCHSVDMVKSLAVVVHCHKLDHRLRNCQPVRNAKLRPAAGVKSDVNTTGFRWSSSWLLLRVIRPHDTNDLWLIFRFISTFGLQGAQLCCVFHAALDS